MFGIGALELMVLGIPLLFFVVLLILTPLFIMRIRREIIHTNELLEKIANQLEKTKLPNDQFLEIVKSPPPKRRFKSKQ